jgi:hypothetical protein
MPMKVERPLEVEAGRAIQIAGIESSAQRDNRRAVRSSSGSTAGSRADRKVSRSLTLF